MASTAFFPEFFNPDMAGKVSRAKLRWKNLPRNATHLGQKLMGNKARRFRETEVMIIRNLSLQSGRVNELILYFSGFYNQVSFGIEKERKGMFRLDMHELAARRPGFE